MFSLYISFIIPLQGLSVVMAVANTPLTKFSICEIRLADKVMQNAP